MVIAHKVEIEEPNAGDMPALVQLLLTAQCSG